MYVFFSQVGGPGGPAAGEPPYAQPNKMSRHHMAAKTAANTTALLPGAAPSVPYNSQQAPAAFPQPQQNHEQLETMLGNLNTDMTRQGIMTIPKGHCAACRKPIVGQVGTSLVLLWFWLTHWGQVTHICVSKLSITGSDNGLSPDRRQAITWTNAGVLLIGPLGTNFSEILFKIPTFSFKKMRLKVSSAKWRPFCPGLNVLTMLHNYKPFFLAEMHTLLHQLSSFLLWWHFFPDTCMISSFIHEGLLLASAVCKKIKSMFSYVFHTGWTHKMS